jgi:hypothetical protein
MIEQTKASEHYPDAWVNDRGKWLHRPWWKVIINTVLRAIQDSTPGARPWLVVSFCDDADERDSEQRPRCHAFGFNRVEMTDGS